MKLHLIFAPGSIGIDSGLNLLEMAVDKHIKVFNCFDNITNYIEQMERNKVCPSANCKITFSELLSKMGELKPINAFSKIIFEIGLGSDYLVVYKLISYAICCCDTTVIVCDDIKKNVSEIENANSQGAYIVINNHVECYANFNRYRFWEIIRCLTIGDERNYAIIDSIIFNDVEELKCTNDEELESYSEGESCNEELESYSESCDEEPKCTNGEFNNIEEPNY